MRKTDAPTGGPALTSSEKKMVDGFVDGFATNGFRYRWTPTSAVSAARAPNTPASSIAYPEQPRPG